MTENNETDPRQRLRPNRSDPLHDQQLQRDVQAVNEQTMRALGPSPPGGLPVQPKRKPDLAKPMTTTPSPSEPFVLQCPIPDDLKETLKNYPEYLTRLQVELNRFVNKYPPEGYGGVPSVSCRYTMTRKKLSSVLSGFHSEVIREYLVARDVAPPKEMDALWEKKKVFSVLPYYIDFGEFVCIADFLAANGK